MKHFSLPLLALLIFSFQSSAEPQIYGTASAIFQHTEKAGGSNMELVSNRSRIGLKGSEVMDQGLEVIYQLEYRMFIDGTESGENVFTQRDSYVGVRGRYGTLMAGKMNTPVKSAQDKVDLFIALEGDIKYLFAGEVRANNVVQYQSPQVAGYLSSSFAYIASEVDGVDPGVSVAGHYRNERQTLYLSLGADRDVQQPGSELVRLVARYSLDTIHLGALAEHFDSVSGGQGILLSILWEANDLWSLKAQAGRSDVNFAGGNQVSLGADYILNERGKLFGYYTNKRDDLGCGGDGCNDEYLAVGISLSF